MAGNNCHQQIALGSKTEAEEENWKNKNKNKIVTTSTLPIAFPLALSAPIATAAAQKPV